MVKEINSSDAAFLRTFGVSFTSADKDRAVKVAERCLQFNDNAEIKKIAKDVSDIFDRWKEKTVIQHIKNSPLSEVGYFSQLFSPFEIVQSEEGRQKKIKKAESADAWEVAPSWIAATPIDLFIHIHDTEFEKIDGGSFYDCLAWLIIFSDKLDNQFFWPSMIREALGLAEFRWEIAEDTGKKLWPSAQAKFESQRQLLSQTKSNKERGVTTKQMVHREASRLMVQEDIHPRNIAARIKNDGLGLSIDWIRDLLKDHPLIDHWRKPKKKKRSVAILQSLSK